MPDSRMYRNNTEFLANLSLIALYVIGLGLFYTDQTA